MLTHLPPPASAFPVLLVFVPCLLASSVFLPWEVRAIAYDMVINGVAATRLAVGLQIDALQVFDGDLTRASSNRSNESESSYK